MYVYPIGGSKLFLVLVDKSVSVVLVCEVFESYHGRYSTMGKYGKQEKAVHESVLQGLIDSMNPDGNVKRTAKMAKIAERGSVSLSVIQTLAVNGTESGEQSVDRIKDAELKAAQKTSVKAGAAAQLRLQAVLILTMSGQKVDATSIEAEVTKLKA